MLTVQYYTPTVLGFDVIDTLIGDQRGDVGTTAQYLWGSKGLIQDIQPPRCM